MAMKLKLVLLFALTFSGLTCGVVDNVEVDSKQKLPKKHAVKSILSEDGDIIDCIDIHKQPAFSHPALRNHTIQMAPSYYPSMETSTEAKGDSSITVTSQLWQRSGSCPEGTVPIRRTRKEDRLGANLAHQEYGRKRPSFSQQLTHVNDSKISYLQLQNHSLTVLITVGFRYLGAKGDIRVCWPEVESNDEYSTSQVSLKSGPFRDYEAIESGWAVNPSVYGDRQTRLFVYWTTDSSKTTGCFDLVCPGFVQTSNEVALGAAIRPISIPGDLSYEVTIYIFKDPNTGNWWMQYGDKINVGYWPPSLFGWLSHHAETVQWGGEVYSSKIGAVHPHTATGMGSGYYSDWSTAGWVKKMRVLENSMVLRFPQWVSGYSDEFDCYDYRYMEDYVEEPEFYYGGPGRSYKCP